MVEMWFFDKKQTFFAKALDFFLHLWYHCFNRLFVGDTSSKVLKNDFEGENISLTEVQL